MAKISLIEATSAGLENIPIKDGAIIFCKDTHMLYKDTDKERIAIGDQIAPLKELHFTGGSTENYDGSTEVTIDIPDSPEDIGAAVAAHDHNYAGSDTPGGAAASADKLNGTNGTIGTIIDDNEHYTYLNITDSEDEQLTQFHIGGMKETGQGFIHSHLKSEDKGIDKLYSEKFPPLSINVDDASKSLQISFA